MLTISNYLKTIKEHSKNSKQSNYKFVNLFLGYILTNLGIGNESIARYHVEPNRLSPIMNGKERFPTYVITEICEPQRKKRLLEVFGELLQLTLDSRLITKARQEILVLAESDERCKPFLNSYIEMENTAFFVETFLDALKAPIVQTPEWRICSVQETGKKALDISNQIMENDQALYKDIPPECSGTREQWANMFRLFPECSRFLISRNGNICGNFSFLVLSKEQENQMLQGTLVDKDLQIADCLPLDEPGTYSIYLLNLSINQGVPVEQYNGLWDSFFNLIADYSERDILISRVYYKAFIPEHEAKMLGRGFYYHKDDKIYGKIYIREVFEKTHGALSAETESLSFSNKTEAESAYLRLFREVDELFFDTRFCQLKPFFYSDIDISESHKDYMLGVAIAEFMRDAMQYASSLVDFLSDYQKKSHEQFEAVLNKSKLIRQSKEEYIFATEDPQNIASQLEQKASNPIAIVKFASIWLSIDKLFMQEDLIHLRPFFYNLHDKLPDCEQDLELGVGLAVRIMSGLIIAEDLLSNIPQAFIISFYEYKKLMWRAQIIQEAAARYPFLARELQF